LLLGEVRGVPEAPDLRADDILSFHAPLSELDYIGGSLRFAPLSEHLLLPDGGFR
jgi:hypothetical protein